MTRCRTLLFVTAFIPLSACSTLASLGDGLGFVPRTEVLLPEVPASPRATFVAEDLTSILDTHVEPDASLAIVVR